MKKIWKEKKEKKRGDGRTCHVPLLTFQNQSQEWERMREAVEQPLQEIPVGWLIRHRDV
jgi:hypothetical protein